MHFQVPRLPAAIAALAMSIIPLAHVASAQTLPQVSVTASDATAREEGLNPGAITIGRLGDASAALTVSYTVSGTATAGSDYTALSGSIALGAGVTSATIAVTPLQDLLIEADETVIVTLTAGSGYTLGSPATATVTIRDNDATDDDDDDGHGHKNKHGDARPGWGHGDTNHEHFGPPGHGCSEDDSCSEESTAGTSDSGHGKSKHSAVMAADDDDDDKGGHGKGKGKSKQAKSKGHR